jgi:hypothetical protein
MAIKYDMITESILQRLPEAIAQSLDALRRCEVCGYRAGRPQPNGEQRALSPGAPAQLMAGAVDQGLQCETTSDIERADTFRGVELVTSDGQQIDAEFVDLGRDFSHRLRCIGMDTDPALPRDRADFLDRLDGADLVVGVHDADQDRLRSDGATHVVRIDATCPVHRKVSDRTAQLLDKPAGAKNGGMLDSRCDDVRRFVL